ncbi:alpha/beta fold hydrolase [Streptomyces sp. NPDC016626]|uniref:alpha/beta fold hydrolase n=1 Tax=Streptomyces sp. NPDC016626 TaxID=3364968 RepID=UPI0036FADBDA
MRDFVYRGSDGCRLHATALGQGPGLVLLHGGGPDRYSLLPLARRLADGFTVVLPDIRGYGRSVCTDPDRHTWAQYAEDVGTLLDHLGLRRAALGGTGLGGTITLRAAAAHPERIRAAVVIAWKTSRTTPPSRPRPRCSKRSPPASGNRASARPGSPSCRCWPPSSAPWCAMPFPAPTRPVSLPPAPSAGTGRSRRSTSWPKSPCPPWSFQVPTHVIPRPWPPRQPTPCPAATSPMCPCPPVLRPRPTWPTLWHRPSGTSSPPT